MWSGLPALLERYLSPILQFPHLKNKDEELILILSKLLALTLSLKSGLRVYFFIGWFFNDCFGERILNICNAFKNAYSVAVITQETALSANWLSNTYQSKASMDGMKLQNNETQ